jgi:hypothetical protein
MRRMTREGQNVINPPSNLPLHTTSRVNMFTFSGGDKDVDDEFDVEAAFGLPTPFISTLMNLSFASFVCCQTRSSMFVSILLS